MLFNFYEVKRETVVFVAVLYIQRRSISFYLFLLFLQVVSRKTTTSTTTTSSTESAQMSSRKSNLIVQFRENGVVYLTLPLPVLVHRKNLYTTRHSQLVDSIKKYLYIDSS